MFSAAFTVLNVFLYAYRTENAASAFKLSNPDLKYQFNGDRKVKKPLLQKETRVWRTYRGGKLIDEFLGNPNPRDTNCPEDWISSFVEAKNKNYIKGEGITTVLKDGVEMPITEAVSSSDFGNGRGDSGVLIKLLDAAERFGIQVHPTPEFSKIHFGTNYGKTECWHILGKRDGADASIYIGFKEGISRERWKELFEAQDIDGMLKCLHRFPVDVGDTVLVRAGTPHAIGEGCFLLEIQEPTDYTMRVEKITVGGEELTPHQIHYGVGEEALLDCFVYEGLSEKAAREKYFLKPRSRKTGYDILVSYSDTPCFALAKARGASFVPDSFVTLVATAGGAVQIGGEIYKLCRGDKLFVPFGAGEIKADTASVIVCMPPERKNNI